MNKTVILIRGCSNSGKSSFANLIFDIFTAEFPVPNEYCVICTADDYFTEDGKYNFDAKQLGAAHFYCRNKFKKALEENIELVILANTSSTEKELSYYIENAQVFGYKLFSIVMEKRFEGGDNGHNVPEFSLSRQEQNIKNSLKLR